MSSGSTATKSKNPSKRIQYLPSMGDEARAANVVASMRVATESNLHSFVPEVEEDAEDDGPAAPAAAASVQPPRRFRVTIPSIETMQQAMQDEQLTVFQRFRCLNLEQQQRVLHGPDLRNRIDAILRIEEVADRDQRFLGTTAQCSCGRCPRDGVAGEKECCGYRAPACHTLEPYFVHHVTDPDALKMAMIQRSDLWAVTADGSSTKQYRYYAYRQYMYWRNGVMGKGNRLALPACCYAFIRAKYPEESGVYEHFKEATEGDEGDE